MKESILKDLLHQIEEIIQMIAVMIIDCIEVEDTPMREEGHPMKEGIPIETEDLQEEEDHKMMGGPKIDMEDTLVEGDPLMEEGPLIEEDPPDDGGPPEGNGGPPRHPDRRGPPGPRGSPGPIRPVIMQQPQVVLDTTTLENTFDNMGQSMLQLTRVQDQTN